MELIRTGLRDAVYDGPGRSAVLRRVIAGKNRKFLNSVDAQVDACRPARRRIGVVVDADGINAIAVFVGTVAAVAELISESPITLIGIEGGRSLVRNADYARLES